MSKATTVRTILHQQQNHSMLQLPIGSVSTKLWLVKITQSISTKKTGCTLLAKCSTYFIQVMAIRGQFLMAQLG